MSILEQLNEFYQGVKFLHTWYYFVDLVSLFCWLIAKWYIFYFLIGYAVNKILNVFKGGALDV